MTDVLARLQVDAGTLTISRLLQDREAAVIEIGRLREELGLLKETNSKRETPQHQNKAVFAGTREISSHLHLRQLLRLSDVCVQVALSRSTVYQRIAEGTFPAPIRISLRSVRWRIEDIDAWQDAVASSNPRRDYLRADGSRPTSTVKCATAGRRR
jgi:prophage regulatory protein